MELKKRLMELPKNKFFMLSLIFIAVSLVAVFAGNIVFKQGNLAVEGNLDLKTAGPDFNIISTTIAANGNANEIFFSLLSSTQERQFGEIEVVSSDVLDGSREGTMNFLTASGGNPAIRLTIKGPNVGIGTQTPGSRLEVENTAAANGVLLLQDNDATCEAQPATTGLTWSCSSDARLKENIRDASSVISSFMNFKIRDYTVKKTGEKGTGVIAQEVMEIYPELVTVGEDGYLMVDEVNSWKLIKAIQELKQENENLKDRIELLEKALEDIAE